MKVFASKHPLMTYCILAYVISWSVFIPLALMKHGVIRQFVPAWTYYFASFGPLLGALVTTGLIGGLQALRELFTRMLQWRVRPIWWVVALSPILLLAVAMVFLRLTRGEWFDVNLLGQIEFLPDLGIGAFFLWLFTYGIGEETGWRGFALPRLQSNGSALRATVALWVIWGCWHVPAFFLVYDPAILPGFMIGLLAGAIIFTWLYNSSSGSILMVSIFHAAFNFVSASQAGKAGLIDAIVSTIIMVWAVIVVILYKPRNLSKSAKFVI